MTVFLTIGRGGMAQLQSGIDDSEAIPSTRLWSLPSALAHLKAFAGDRAGQLGKSVSLGVRCPAVLVRQPIIDAMIPSLVQLLRNAVEHGIEDTTERLILGKPLSATLTLDVAIDADALVFAISDDGRGMEIAEAEQLRSGSLAVSSEALHLVAGDAWRALLLRHGVAVANGRRGPTSGLKRATARLAGIGGRIALRTRRGEGTTLVVTIPRHGDGNIVVADAARQLVGAPTTASA